MLKVKINKEIFECDDNSNSMCLLKPTFRTTT